MPTLPQAYGQPLAPSDALGMAQASPYRYDPPAAIPAGQPTRPIDFLVPGSKQHAYVLQYLLNRLNWSEEKMKQFYPRWQANELRLQAYVTLPKYDEIIKNMYDTRTVRAPNEIVVPYAWATQQTIITYLLHTFGGRKPIFDVGAYRPEQVKRASNLETLLQYNSDYQRFIYHLYNYFQNGETYGLAVIRSMWKRDTRMKTVTRPAEPQMAYLMAQMGQRAPDQRVTESAVSFEGNGVATISPYMFFPDPRVPMVEVADKGEFVFWRAYEGRHMLLREEAAGNLKWVKYAGNDTRAMRGDNSQSYAGLRALGDSLTDGGPGQQFGRAIANNYQVDQGTVEIIPKELGLGPGSQPEKWLFTILNKCQIVQAEPVNLNHGQHPVSVTEPNAFGHSFGQLGTSDLLAPMQDIMSWMFNSHMYNVRASLNNIWAVDPNKVEMDDFLNPLPGGIIRLKSTPWAPVDARTAMSQFPVQDITRAHLTDMQAVQRMANDLTGASDNIRGNQASGGRKTATEVRTAYEAGGSRLASRSMLYSAMGLSPMANQWGSNYQQFMTEEMEIRILGKTGMEGSVRISPREIEGDYFFPIHDGTLPLDKVAMLDVWKEIWQAVVQDPTGQMQRIYNGPAIFRFMAQLGGAQNLDDFKLTMGGQDGIQQQAQAGNLVPLSELPGMMGHNGMPPGMGAPPVGPGLPPPAMIPGEF